MKHTTNIKPRLIGNVFVVKQRNGYMLIDRYTGRSVLIEK